MFKSLPLWLAQPLFFQAVEEVKAQLVNFPFDIEKVSFYEMPPSMQKNDAFLGGFWEKGKIFYRKNYASPEIALLMYKHELAHEAFFQACGENFPAWAQEAFAIWASGEGEFLKKTSQNLPLMDKNTFLQSIKWDSPLSLEARRGLVYVLEEEQWNPRSCADVSKLVKKLLKTSDNHSLEYVFGFLSSGRVLEEKAFLDKAPAASLLKIPLTSALKNIDAGWEEKLLESRSELFFDRIKRLTAEEKALYLRLIRHESFLPWPSLVWVGERSADGHFFQEWTLKETWENLRVSLLYGYSQKINANYLSQLKYNGFKKNSTLENVPLQMKNFLRRHEIASKTGTLRNKNGFPLLGYTAFWWPASNPIFLAVFKKQGVSGSKVAWESFDKLYSFQQKYGFLNQDVVVELTSVKTASRVKVPASQDIFEYDKKITSYSGCFPVLKYGRKMINNQKFCGVLDLSQRVPLLRTDPLTYVEGVLAAEASSLKGEARMALASLILWNGMRGFSYHQNRKYVCDTTLCQVFLGLGKKENWDLAALKANFAALEARNALWIFFEKGGVTPWKKAYRGDELKRLLEKDVLHIFRVRKKNGEIFMHVQTFDDEYAYPCEILRNTLKLPSCPEKVLKEGDFWVFEGVGEGHGRGVSFDRLQRWQEEGMDSLSMLRRIKF